MLTRESLMNLTTPRCTFGRAKGILPEPEQVLEWFKVLEAGWVYTPGSKKAHAILHSGKHSNGFFLCKRVLQCGNLREILAACLLDRLWRARGGFPKIDGVFGSPYSSIMLAGDVGRMLRVKTYVPEKFPSNDPKEKRMIFKPDDPIPAGAKLLQVEELITTFDSGEATRQAIVDGNPNPVTFYELVGVLVHRPPVVNRRLPDGREIVPFIERQVDAYDPADCPMCKEGSEAVFPKGDGWAKLTA